MTLLSLILCLPLLYAMARPLVPATAQDLARAIERVEPGVPVLVADAPPPVGLLTVLAGGRARFTDRLPPPAQGFGALLIPRPYLEDTSYPYCQRTPVAADYRGLEPAGLLAALRVGEGGAYLARHERAWVMVTCPPERE